MSETSMTDSPSAGARLLRSRGLLAAVVLVPLAFTGLFVAAFAHADDRLDHIPAAIVNEDEMVTQTAEDGSTTPILAGRQLVTELTDGGQNGFDWQITNAEDAAGMLGDGEVYAVLTIPSTFSASVVSLQGDQPRQASFRIATDDAHSYIGGAVAQVVATTLKTEFGQAITERYLSGLFSGLSRVGASLSDAADGAGSLADGAGDLADGAGSLTDGADTLATGLSRLADGAGSAATGARSYVDGVTAYTTGVTRLGNGLTRLAAGDDALDRASSGVADYTRGVSQTAAGLDQVNQVVQAYPTVDARTKAALQQITSGLDGLSSSGPALSGGVSQAVDGVQSGISTAASGAKKLAAAGRKLDTGGRSLTTGLDALSAGATRSAEGAGQLGDGAATLAHGVRQLGDGARSLADGLSDGARQASSYTEDQADAQAATVSDPIAFSATTDNPVSDIGQVIATVLVPLGLWIGAFAVFLVLRPVSRRSLVSTASDGRLVLASLVRAGAVAVAQSVLLVLLMHGALGTPWDRLPQTLPFCLLMALAFTAFHLVLTFGLGRAGSVVSLFLLAVQVTSVGGVYPIQLVAEPFQWISPVLPLTYGVSGMQAIVSGASATPVLTASVVLVVVGVVSVLLAVVAVGRSRRAVPFGLLPRTAP
jgi:putative membrane protein